MHDETGKKWMSGTAWAVARRTFVKGVIISGAAVSPAGYLFRGSPLLGALAPQPRVGERLITLNVNGQQQFYFEKIRDRDVCRFPLVNVASAMRRSGNTIQNVRIAVNDAAARRLRLALVEQALTSRLRTAAIGEMAGKLACRELFHFSSMHTRSP